MTCNWGLINFSLQSAWLYKTFILYCYYMEKRRDHVFCLRILP